MKIFIEDDKIHIESRLVIVLKIMLIIAIIYLFYYVYSLTKLF